MSKILGAVIYGVVLAGLTFGQQYYEAWKIDRAHKQEIAALQAQCAADKQLTNEVSDEYQKKLAMRDRQLVALKRVQSTRCVVPTPGTATGRDGASQSGEHAGLDGVPAVDLLDFAGEAEKYRLQLIGCQDFIKRVWKLK